MYAVLFPQLDWARHNKLAENTLNKLSPNNRYHYDFFCQYLLTISSHCIQNIDLRSVVAFLGLLFPRLTNIRIQDCLTNQSKIVPYTIQVRFYPKDHVERVALDSSVQKNVLQNIMYYEEEVVYDKDQIINNETKTVIYALKKPEQVIPLGYPSECVLWDLANSDNFEPQQKYKLHPLEKIKVRDMEIEAIFDEKSIDSLKDSLLNKETMYSQAVLHKKLPMYEAKIYGQSNLEFYRLSEQIARPAYFEQLKMLSCDVVKLFNILSDFHDRNEFGIDEIHNVGEKWHRKKKRNMLGDEKKKTIKKEELNQDEYVRLLSLNMFAKNNVYFNSKRIQSQNDFLKDKLRITLEQDRFINLDKYISAHDCLPWDNDNPFHKDVIEYAKQSPLQILVYGRPKCGKTTLAKNLAKSYEIVHVSMENAIQKIFQRQKFFEENPPQTDEDGNPKDGLSPLEKCILETLSRGSQIDNEDLLDLLNKQMKSLAVACKGFVLDMPLEYSAFDWVNKIIDNKLYTPKMGCKYFSHIIELEQSEDEWKIFANGVMQRPEDLSMSSTYDRYLLAKPKAPPAEDEEEEEPPADGEEKPILLESNLIRTNNQPVIEAAKVHLLLTHIHPRNHLKIKVSGKNVNEILAILSSSLYKIPLAKKLEGADKQLLAVGLEEKKVFRKWSSWGTIDPVELSKLRLVPGKSEFAAQYAGRVFLFQNTNNLEAFLALPRRYLSSPPKLPSTFNLVINGPRKSGKKTIANLIAQTYGLKVIDIEKIVTKKLIQQKAFTQSIPSNPALRSTSVHLSEPQWKDFSKGNGLSAKDILPIVFYEMGIKLQKKPQDWGIERTEEEKAQLEKEREEKEKEEVMKKNAAKKNPKKKDKEPKEEERPKTPPLEDLNLKDIIPEVNFAGKLNEIRGFIIVGYPNNEEQLQALKSFNVPIDKFILLNDNSEENPNKILSQRLNQTEIEQLAVFNTAMGPIKDALGEQVFKQININDTPENIAIKIRNLIDPFFCKPDDDALNRVSADIQQQDDPIQWGFCQKYCPVVLNEGWLVKGKQDMECGVEGRRYRCFTQKQLNTFKQNPKAFINQKNLDIPPRILFMGIRGVGLKTELIKINQKYKIPILNLKENILSQLENDKIRRKTERYYNKGFKIPEFDEEGKQIQDAELNEEAPDFDKKANEVQTVKRTFEGMQEILINGNFFDVEQKVETPLVELLSEAKRLPEMVVMLKVDEKRWLPRVFDTKVIQLEHQKIVQQLREQKEIEKAEARKKAIQAGEQYQQPQEEEDLGAPKLEDMIAQKKEKLIAQREADLAKLEELAESFRGTGVQVVMLDCQRDVQHVFDKIVYAIKPCLEKRQSRWQKVNMLKTTTDRVSSLQDNFIVKESRFGKLNPLTLMRPVKPYPLIYKDRIYYLDSEDQREEVMERIELLQTNRPVPHDVHVVPVVYIIGKPKCGKSSLVKALSKKTGMTIIKIRDIVEQFATEHFDPTINKIVNALKSGETLTDEMMIDLIQRRVQMADCAKYGWILDNMPRNRNQAQLLARRGLGATCVFSIQLSDNQIKKRIYSSGVNKYGYDPSVVFERLAKYQNNQTVLQNYFVLRHNNLKYLDGRLSKWGLLDTSLSFVTDNLKSKYNLIRSIICKEPCGAVGVGFSFNAILNNLSEWGTHCLVTYKTQREYANTGLAQAKYLAHYKKKIYALASDKQYHDFLANPDLYITSEIPSNYTPPELLFDHQISSFYEKVENKGYCMVELTKKNLLKGNSSFTILYKNKIFGIGKSANIKYFLRNPSAYQMSRLQDKLPVEFDKKSELKKIAKRSDCTAFLEHHLGNIMMRVLAQLGYRRLKYPTLSSKETALKFLAISLKANNPNKDEEYRNKYKEKLQKFIKHCSYPQELREEFKRKEKAGQDWKEWDQENLLKLCEEYHEFLEELKVADKNHYFSQFIN